MTALPKKVGKLPWNENSTSFLIQLYSENIKNFLNPHKTQIVLWRRLVEFMKMEEDLPQHFKDNLTAGHAQRKWISLRQRFKDAFYDEDLQVHFPYFHRLNEMFTEYAESQLSNRLNETTQEEISAYVNDLLQNSSFEIDALRCETNDMNDLPSKPALPQKSEATKVRQYIAKLPRESISVSQASLRVVPNTPFNRKYHLSTIVNQKSNFMSNVRRSQHASPEESKPKKAHLAFEYDNFDEPSQDIMIIESLDETFLEQQEWKVESLDGCELSGIHGQPIKIDPVKFVPKFSKKFDPRGTIDQIQVKKSFKTPLVQKRQISASRTSLQADNSNSILEVPSLPSINIIEVETLPSLTGIATPGVNETLRAAPDVRVIPKTLNFTNGNASNNCTLNDLSQPPQWFQSFLTRYDADMSKINTKMDSIHKKLDKIITQTAFD